METHCEDGECLSEPKPEGTTLSASLQLAGDCRLFVCDGNGGVRAEDDDSDAPAGDGNPCHEVHCESGARQIKNAPDSQRCNDTGRCEAGACSVCLVGAACTVEMPCHTGRVKSCDGGAPVCEALPQSGTLCGTDATGRTQYCVAGTCTMPCREGSCTSGSDPCQVGHWECSGESAEPTCVPTPSPDGTACGESSICYAGSCTRTALINGDFSQGFTGWTLRGDAAQFQIMPDSANFQRVSLSTSPDGASSGGSARGALEQRFTVPADATALRFNVFGGHAHVRLKDARGDVLEQCTGIDMNGVRIPVSWDLTARRGQSLTIAIEDDEASGDFAYVSVTGFDVIRESAGAMVNSQFKEGFAGWESTGDGLNFYIYEDYNYSTSELSSVGSGVAAYGRRRSVSTYARSQAAAALADATRGTLSQTFTVPDDAVALRFNVCGGRTARVSLFQGRQTLYTQSGNNSDAIKVPVSWTLVPHRGKTVRLSIEDNETTAPLGYLGTTGFDVITSHNGP